MPLGTPLGMIAGNGRFPALALEAARQAGLEVVVIAIKEEASPELEKLAARCHWISLGALSKLIEICKKESITQIMMCGQVKHVKIFSSIVPDWRLVKLLASLEAKNTDALIGGVAKILADEGITLTDSTLLLKDLLAPEGVLTRRKPSSAPGSICCTPRQRACSTAPTLSASTPAPRSKGWPMW